MVVSTAELAKVLGLTRQMLNKLSREGILSKVGKGKWALEIVFAEFMKYKIELATKPLEEKITKIRNSKDPDTRLRSAKADLMEIKLLEKQKELIPFELSKRILLEAIGSIKEYVYGIPNKVAVRILKAHSKEETKMILKNAIDEVFTKYSNIPVKQNK